MLRGTDMALLRHIDESGYSLSEFFCDSDATLCGRLGLRKADERFGRGAREQALTLAEEEIKYAAAHRIRIILPADGDYSQRLLQMHDAPLALYCLGDADLNCPHILSIVGTRQPTPHGQAFVRTAVEEIHQAVPDTVIVSGLAYGIDIAAHSAALASGCVTIAVVAHGLDTIYPASHRDAARRIINAGGAIISEYPRGAAPLKGRFLERNRIIAGLADGTFVAESDLKGGAMSTASTAFRIDREVMALPGRPSDRFSRGCNHLIRKNKASLVASAGDILDTLGWNPDNRAADPADRTLFPELDEPQKSIFEALAASSLPLSPDTLHQRLGLPIGQLLSTLGEMEFEGLVVRYPGNRFSTA